MDLSLSHEQSMVKNAAAEFLRQELPKERVDELFRSADGFDPDLWKKMCDLGWASMLLPSEYGGQASDFTTTGVLYEELGASLCPSPLLSSSALSAQYILEAGSDEQKRTLLPAIARGDQIIALAFTESGGGWNPASIGLRATPSNGSYVLQGAKAFVPDAHLADRLLVVGKADSGGVSVFLVDKGADGLTIRPHTGWLGDVLSEVTFDGVRVPAASAVGEVGDAWNALANAMDRATILLCAYIVGGCRRVLEISVEYSQTRIQFGVPIGNFQRVQDHLIEALNAEQATRWTTYEALWKLDEGMPDAQLAISMAKAVASDGYFKACEAAHHVHGGIGVDMNYGLAYYTQKARTLQHYLGDAVHHRKRMAELLSNGS